MPISFSSRPVLVAYITCGDPDLATSLDIALAAIDAGASIIELGVPFSDPLADGPVIQRASQRALQHNISIEQVILLGKKIRRRSPAGLIIFSYLNPILRMGFANFAEALHDAGIDGALVTDLPVEEADDYLREMRKRDLATVFLAAPTSTDHRLKQIAEASRGFIYAVSRTGVTGASQQIASDAEKLVRRLRNFSQLPIAVGFGISTAGQFATVAQFADAGVVGSAIVQIIEEIPGNQADSVGKFVRQLLSKDL